MILNTAKGWYGSISKTGKNAAIHAFLKLAGFKSGFRKPKKKIEKKETDSLSHFRDNLVIVKAYQNAIKYEGDNQRTKSKDNANKKKEEKIAYHINQTNTDEEMKFLDNPTCTKYTPKYSLIFPKLLTGPIWEKVSGRKYKKVEMDEKDFLITHDSAFINDESKCLVNMDKTTQRGNFLFSNKRNEKSFVNTLPSKTPKKAKISRDLINNDKKINKDIKTKNFLTKSVSQPKNITNKIISTSESVNEKRKNKKYLILNNFKNENNKKVNKLSHLNIETDYSSKDIGKVKNKLIKSSYTINKSKQNKINLKKSKKSYMMKEDSSNSIEDIYPNSFRRRNNAINFEKTISREKLSKIHSKEKYLDILNVPDYTAVHERPIMLTFYNTPKNYNKLKRFKGLETNFNYDANKAYYIRRDHSSGKAPDFNLIIPRPYEKTNPLPSFMQKIYDREAVYCLNDKTLEFNEYSKQRLGNTDSSFFPKTSYNNLVNIKMMASNNFEEDYGIDEIRKKKEEMKSKLKFGHKSLEKMVKEGGLKKFDNITLKTIYKTKNYLNKDLDRYLLGLKE